MDGAKKYVIEQRAARRAALEEEARLWVEQTLAKEAANDSFVANKDHYVFGYFDVKEVFFIGVGRADDDVKHLRDSATGQSVTRIVLHTAANDGEEKADAIYHPFCKEFERDERDSFSRTLSKRLAGGRLDRCSISRTVAKGATRNNPEVLNDCQDAKGYGGS